MIGLLLLCLLPGWTSATIPGASPAPAASAQAPRFSDLLPEDLVRAYLEYRRLRDESAARGEAPPGLSDGEYRSAGRAGELEGRFRAEVPSHHANLVRLLRESDRLDREMACVLLCFSRDKAAAAVALLSSLSEAGHTVHDEAARTLYAFASSSSVPIPAERVWPLLSHAAWACRNRGLAVAAALRARGTGAGIADDLVAVRDLVALTGSPHHNIRRPAVSLLRRLFPDVEATTLAEWADWYARRFPAQPPPRVPDRVARALRAVPGKDGGPPLLFLDDARCRHLDEMEGKLALWRIEQGRRKGVTTAAFVVSRPDLPGALVVELSRRAVASGVDEVVTYPRGETDLSGTLVVDPAAGRAHTVDEALVAAYLDYEDALSRAAAPDAIGGRTFRVIGGEWRTDGRPSRFERRFRTAATEKRESLLAFLALGAPVQREMAACLLGFCAQKKQTVEAMVRACREDASHGVHRWAGWHLSAWATLPGLVVPPELAVELARHPDAGCRGRAVTLAEALGAPAGTPGSARARELCRAIVLATREGAGDQGEKLHAILARLSGAAPAAEPASWEGWFRRTFGENP